jgi:hypothetical protein
VSSDFVKYGDKKNSVKEECWMYYRECQLVSNGAI